MTPLISVIIPAYNGEATIAETIRSILNQTYPHFELLVINDGSKDNTAQIVEAFDDPRIKLHNFENRGLSASRNRGMRLGQGEYFSFIDADDLWTEDKLECQLNALLERPEADVAYSRTTPFDENARYQAKNFLYEGNVFNDLLEKNFVGSGSNILVSRKAALATGEFDETLRACEDWDYYLRLAKNFQYVVVPKAQILYRIVATSMSGKTDVLIENAIVVLKRAVGEPLPPHILAGIYKSAVHITLGRSKGQGWAGNVQALSYAKKALNACPALLLSPEYMLLLMKITFKSALPEDLYRSLILSRDQFLASLRRKPAERGVA